MNRKVKFGILTGVIIATLGYLIYVGIQTGSMYYLSVAEFASQQARLVGERVRVNGNIVVGSVNYDSRNLKLSFAIRDEKSGDTLKVTYRGAPPDLLEQEGVSIVVEGTYDQKMGVFNANNLLVKCPSKYEKKETREV